MEKDKTNSKQTILVTGGAGYIGSHTVKELIKNDFNVVVVDSLESGHLWAIDKKAKFEKLDLCNIQALKRVFEKYSPIAVIDFAAYLAVGESMENPKKYFRNNVENFINILEVMKEYDCKFLIKSSTAAVYGNPRDDNDIPWNEDFIEKYHLKKSALLSGKWETFDAEGEDFFKKFLDFYEKKYSKQLILKLSKIEIEKLRIPMSIYGVTKLLDEIVMKKYDKLFGIKSVALRYFNVCGADPNGELGDAKLKPTNLMSLAIAQLLGEIKELSVFGSDYPTPDGTGVRDYIHPSDLATAHVVALKYIIDKKKSDVFNLATGKGSSVLEVISEVEKVAGKKVKFKIIGRRSGDPAISIADPSKVKNVLHWRTKYSLNDMALTAWNFARKRKN